jgi:CubicO group peptidase (beta-lactamase class C family)
MRAFDLIGDWPTRNVAVAVLHDASIIDTFGDIESRFPIASVSKLFTAWAVHVAAEEGSVTLDDVVTESGATVRHLLAHAGGFQLEGETTVAAPATKRIYSNAGYEVLAEFVAQRTGMPFDEYLDEAVVQGIGATSAELIGSPAKDVMASVMDVVRLAVEMQRPSIISQSTLIEAITVQFAELEGIVPGFGKFSPCPWGLGPEIRGAKSPHWTGTRNSASTFGHFGASGTFCWIDPVANAACVMLSDLPFDNWDKTLWPKFNDAVLNEIGSRA